MIYDPDRLSAITASAASVKPLILTAHNGGPVTSFDWLVDGAPGSAAGVVRLASSEVERHELVEACEMAWATTRRLVLADRAAGHPRHPGVVVMLQVAVDAVALDSANPDLELRDRWDSWGDGDWEAPLWRMVAALIDTLAEQPGDSTTPEESNSEPPSRRRFFWKDR